MAAPSQFRKLNSNFYYDPTDPTYHVTKQEYDGLLAAEKNPMKWDCKGISIVGIITASGLAVIFCSANLIYCSSKCSGEKYALNITFLVLGVITCLGLCICACNKKNESSGTTRPC